MTLKRGDKGNAVSDLQNDLADAGISVGGIDGDFGGGTETAVKAFQSKAKLPQTGIVDDATQNALRNEVAGIVAARGALGTLKTSDVSKAGMFPGAPLANIVRYLPSVMKALVDANLALPRMGLMALATIRAETAGFVPIDEGRSKFNTSPDGHPFDLYDNRANLGNRGAPDGDRFKGRGFVQLTGRSNYDSIGKKLGMGQQLVDNPALANDPDIASRILAAFIDSRRSEIEAALTANDLALARKIVNGGSHGKEDFIDAYQKGLALIA